MFIPSGLNKKKLAALDEQTKLSEQEEMRARDEARQGAYNGRMRMDGMMQDLQKPTTLGAGKANRSRREEFKFEDDDGEQEANNEEIDDQIDQISRGVSALHGAARMINAELEDQIQQVGRITDKVSICIFLLYASGNAAGYGFVGWIADVLRRASVQTTRFGETIPTSNGRLG
jgi:hypothetical protein